MPSLNETNLFDVAQYRLDYTSTSCTLEVELLLWRVTQALAALPPMAEENMIIRWQTGIAREMVS